MRGFCGCSPCTLALSYSNPFALCTRCTERAQVSVARARRSRSESVARVGTTLSTAPVSEEELPSVSPVLVVYRLCNILSGRDVLCDWRGEGWFRVGLITTAYAGSASRRGAPRAKRRASACPN